MKPLGIIVSALLCLPVALSSPSVAWGGPGNAGQPADGGRADATVLALSKLAVPFDAAHFLGVGARQDTALSSDASRAAWTVALFVNADNDLEYAWPRFTLPALKGLAPNEQVNVVAVVDWRDRKRGVELLEIRGKDVRVVASWPEKNFGSGKTLEWFLRQIARRYPARHLAVGLLDHGYAWRYISCDDSSGGDRITMPELRRALQDAGVDVDILAFDACKMAAVEVIYQLGLSGRVKYVVASEETIDQDGLPYDGALGPLMAHPEREPRAVVQDVIAAWQRYYRPLRCFSWVSLSGLDVDAVMRARRHLGTWVQALRDGLPLYRTRYAAALRHSIYAWDSWHVDLADVAARLAADPGVADVRLKALSAVVADEMRGAVVALANGSYARAFGGMTVWWGTGADWISYSAAYRGQVAFARQIGWHSFLKAYNASRKGPSTAPDPPLRRASYGLTDITFVDARHGWAAGYDNVSAKAIIARTTDGGRRWMVQSPDWWDSYMVSSLAFLDTRRGWAVGSEGQDGSLVLKTVDGGRHWTWQRARTGEYLLDTDVLSGSRAWIVGSNSTRLLTTDGGRSWQGTRRASDTDWWSVDFVDAAHGWMAGGNAATRSGLIRYTSDGGTSWTTQLSAPGVIIYRIRAQDTERAWAVGGDAVSGAGLVLHTDDAGRTWRPSWNGETASWLADVAFADQLHGWAVGEGGGVLRTVDGGASWERVPVPTRQDLTAVCFIDASHGWIVGDGETMLRTVDGGHTWTASRLALDP